jgi:sulfur carrier protein ThiS
MKANGGVSFAFIFPYASQRCAKGRCAFVVSLQRVKGREESHMAAWIEVRAFMDLSGTFRERNWSNPKEVAVQGEMTGTDLLALLDLPEDMVEVIFVNGKAFKPAQAVVTGGDRVALAPPGVPGPYRVLLGFKKMG